MASSTQTRPEEQSFYQPCIGHKDLIADIIRTLTTSNIRIVEISGPPGIGKSHIADEVTRQTKHVQRSAGKFYYPHTVSLRDYSSVNDIVKYLTDVLELPFNCKNETNFCRSLQKVHLGKHFVFIYENVEALLFHSIDSVKVNDLLAEFLEFCNILTTESDNIQLILTTQVKLDFVRNLSSVERIMVPPLSEEDSAAFLKYLVLDPQVTISDDTLKEVIKQSTGIPRKLIDLGLKLNQMTFQVPAINTVSVDRSCNLLPHFEVPLNEMTILNSRCDLVSLAYIPGSFSAPAAAAVLGAQKTSFVKHDVLSPLLSNCLISFDTPQNRFSIQPFLRHFLEDVYLLYRNDTKIRNRFCIFFGYLLKQITIMESKERLGERFSLFNLEIDNLQKLLLEAVHCLDENYELFFDIAYNAEFYITNLLPKKESVDFYQAMCNAAQRHSSRHYGIMLSSFGQVLGFAQTRISEAYQQYMKALDYLRPLGESTDLAWLYSHIGYVWHESGKFKKAERYFNIALRMLRRENNRLILLERQYSVQTRPVGLRQARIMLDRTQSSVLSSMGLMYNYYDDYKRSIECHKEAMQIRKKLFGLHPSIGSAYNNLCLVYDRAGDRKTALECAKKGLNIKKIFIKQPSNAVLVSLLNVALFTHTYEGDADKALLLLNEAYEIRKSLGLKHSLTAVIHVYQGDMQLHSKRWKEAAQSFSNAVDRFRDMEVSPRKIAEALQKWGVALKNLGLLKEAEEKLKESLRITHDMMAEGHAASEDAQKISITVKELDDLRKTMSEPRVESSRR